MSFAVMSAAVMSRAVMSQYAVQKLAATLTPFVLSLSKHERHGIDVLRSPPSTRLRTGFDKLRANGRR